MYEQVRLAKAPSSDRDHAFRRDSFPTTLVVEVYPNKRSDHFRSNGSQDCSVFEFLKLSLRIGNFFFERCHRTSLRGNLFLDFQGTRQEIGSSDPNERIRERHVLLLRLLFPK